MNYILKSVAVLSLGIAFFSCNKREIIPAPTSKVDLKSHFYGKINGTNIELTQNVNGYAGTSGVDLIVNANTLDSAIYHSKFSSSNSLQQVNIAHGSIVFDANASERPSVSTFESFYLSGPNLVPSFSVNGLGGISFSFTDGSGKEWKSKTIGTAQYTKMGVESDENGDYAKFRVEFDTRVYYSYLDVPTQTTITDSMEVVDAVYTGWYKR